MGFAAQWVRKEARGTNQVKKNFLYQITYRILTILTPLITSPILSRALGAEKLGLFSATLALVSYFLMISMLGVENHGNRSIAAAQGDRNQQQTLFWNIYAVQMISSLLAIALYAIAFLFIPPERTTISLLQGLWLIGALFNINWFFFGTEQFRLTVARNIVIKVLTVLLIVLFVRTPDDLLIYVIIMAGDTVLSNLVVWPFLRRNIGFEMPKLHLMKEHMKPILVLFVPILAMSVFHIMDKTMLDWLGTETDVGYYYSADKVINMPLSIISGLGTVMLPRVSNEYSKGNNEVVRRMLKKSTELTIFMTCAIGIGIAAIANEFVPWFFGKGFEPCITLVYWFVPILFAKAIGELIRTQYMIPAHMDRYYTIAVSIGAGVNLISNYILIGRFGALGAVLGTLLAEAAVTIYELYCTRGRIPFLLFTLQNAIYLVPAGLMLLCVRLLAGRIHMPMAVQLICMICIGGVIYGLTNLTIWKVKKESIFHEIKLRLPER